MEDDSGIPFSQFPIQIDMIRLQKGEPYLHYENLFLATGHYIAEKIAIDLLCPVILVDNLQKKLAEYNLN